MGKDSKTADNAPHLFDSVRMSKKEYQSLLSDMERASVAPIKRHGPNKNRRGQTRYIYHQDAKLICQMSQDLGASMQLIVRCRNISIGGLGFLHGAYVHPGTRVVLTLISATKQGYRINGSIVRCRHLTKNIHEVGVAFDETIDLDAMLPGLAEEILPESEDVAANKIASATN